MWLFPFDMRIVSVYQILLFHDAPLWLIESTVTAKCTIDVMIAGPPVRANWYDLWGAAVMVVAMCARFGRAGVWSGKGMKTFCCRAVATEVWSQRVRPSLPSVLRIMPLQLCPRLQREVVVTNLLGP